MAQVGVMAFETETKADKAEKVRDEPFNFVEIVDRFESPLLKYVMSLLGSGRTIDPEDVVQEVFLRLYRQVEQHGSASIVSMKSWLFRVAHNRVMDLARSKVVEKKAAEVQGQLDEQKQPDPTDQLADMVRREAGEKAMNELQKLPDEERSVIVLKIVHGMKLREISEVTGLSTGNIDYRIKKGLKSLAVRLKAGGII